MPGHVRGEDLRGVIPEEQRAFPPSRPVNETLSDAPGGRTESEHEYYAPMAESPLSKAQSVLEEVLPPPSEDIAEASQAAGIGGSHSDGGTGSSSSSSSSETEVSDGEQDWVGDLGPELSKVVPTAKPVEPDLEFWKHPKTLTIHSFAAGSLKNIFSCGRKHTSDYVRVTESAFLSSRLCEVCRKSKPLRDVGALTSMIDKGLRSR